MINVKEAENLQKELAGRIVLEDSFCKIETVAGMDVSNTLFDPAKMIYAAAVVLRYPGFQRIEEATVAQKQEFPYIPGLLGFREAPALIEAFKNLQTKPDLIMVDGHGISHPRRLGIASHIGVVLDIPTIGVAKSILVGAPAEPLGEEPGSQTPLVWNNETIGMLLRTKRRAHPIIISCGHEISLKTATAWVLQSLTKYRLPEPTRNAHIASNLFRKRSR